MATRLDSPSDLDPRTGLDARISRLCVMLIRVAVALMWMRGALWKNPPEFGALEHFTRHAVDYPVFGPYAWLVENVVLPNITLFGWFTLFLEAGLGAFLLVGLATRLWALIGLGQSVAITLSELYVPGEWPWALFLMIVIHIALFATAAGRSYGVDGALRPYWAQSSNPLAKVLVRVS